jgi:hypothetical protein
MLGYPELCDLVQNLSYQDRSFLRGVGLEKLDDVYVAYPVSFETDSLCVLLVRGLSPRKASELSELEAQRQILVLKRSAKAWVRAWPMKQERA